LGGEKKPFFFKKKKKKKVKKGGPFFSLCRKLNQSNACAFLVFQEENLFKNPFSS